MSFTDIPGGNAGSNPFDALYDKLCLKIDQTKEELKDEFKNELSTIKKEQEAIVEKLNTHDTELVSLKKQLGEKNIVIYGLKYEDSIHDNISGFVISELNDLLDLNLTEDDVEDAFKLGKTPQAPIKVRLTSLRLKNLIFARKKDLKGSKISINHDLPKELRIIQMQQRKAKLALKDKNKRLLSPDNSPPNAFTHNAKKHMDVNPNSKN